MDPASFRSLLLSDSKNQSRFASEISALPGEILADLDFANSIRAELAGASLLFALLVRPCRPFFIHFRRTASILSVENIFIRLNLFIRSLVPVARSIKILKRRLPDVYLHR